MNQNEVLSALKDFRMQLDDEVVATYDARGEKLGWERWEAWCSRVNRFLVSHLPTEIAKFELRTSPACLVVLRRESAVNSFWRSYGEAAGAFLESLIIDIGRGEYFPSEEQPKVELIKEDNGRNVFIVHGHDRQILSDVTLFIERLGFNPVVLQEHSPAGNTIIEQIEKHTSDIVFAIVLYTPDDLGRASSSSTQELSGRARQNVVFEHGYLMAKLTRSKVATLKLGDVETPSDISGVIYSSQDNWKVKIAGDMEAAGCTINDENFRKALR